jgi:ribonucleoside-diphosphate reductase alpha chain
MFRTKLAREIWETKYKFGNETPLQTFERVARALASVEKNPDEWYERFLHTLVRFDSEGKPIGLKCTTGGRITANIGTSFKKATLLNCFISSPVSNAHIIYNKKTDNGEIQFPVEYTSDVNPDDLINIFLTITEQAKTLASEGGYGLNFDFIRPRGSLIKGTGIKHPGVVAYMKIWDAVSQCIVQGDQDGYVNKIRNHLQNDDKFHEVREAVKNAIRKGAMLAALSCSHPDCEEFVRAKQLSGVLTKFNISVVLTDDFLRAVERDDFFDQSFNGVVYKRVKARELYDLIMKSCYDRAEPGVLFADNMMRNNPVAYLGRLTSTNPCLLGDSLLLTKMGLQKIENLVKSVAGDIVEIWNGSEWVPSEIFCTGIKPVIEMRMSNGLHLKATQDHIVECFDGLDTQEFSLGNSIGKKITRLSGSPWVGIPLDLSRDELICLGFAFGDATFHKASNRYKYVHIGEDDKDAEAYFDRIGEKLPEESRYDKRGLSVGFADMCKELNFPPVPLPERFLSDRILQLPPNQLCSFLCGMFSANGSVLERGRITYKSTCRKLVDQLQIILMALDMKSYVTTNKAHDVKFSNGTYTCKESYDLNISSDDIIRFKNLIGFIQEYKEEKLNILIGIKTGRRLEPKVVSIKYLGEERVYDFKEPKTHWAFVNGLKVHNCGEIPGLSSIGTVCLLGSLNLPMYVKIGIDKEPYFDFDEYAEDVKNFMRMLDNVNDLTYAPLPSYQWVVNNLRQVGMGVNGLGSALMMLGIPYGNPQAVNFTEQVCQIKENLTWQVSAELAKEKGTFGAYKKDLFEATEYFNSDRIHECTKDVLRKYGARNAKTTTVPPLGNSSLLSDVTSNGIEPVYLLEYERKVICQEWPEGLNADNVKTVLKRHKEKDYEFWKGAYNEKQYYYEPHNRGLCEINIVRDFGYQWLLDNFPDKDHSAYLMTTKNIKIEDHLNIQTVVQHFNNQSTSKTCNLSNDYPFEEFKSLYLQAWKLGLNGFTTYREGSMESVLSDISKGAKREIIARDIKLPAVFINGPTSVIKREGKKFYLHFSYLPEDFELKFPIVIWVHTNAKYQADELRVCNKAARNLSKLALGCGVAPEIVKETVTKANQDYPHNRLGRMVSLCLRHNIPREDILVSLMGIDGDNISTLLTAVRKFLSKTLADGTALKGLKCPKCGGRLVMDGGCQRCIDCSDYNVCG